MFWYKGFRSGLIPLCDYGGSFGLSMLSIGNNKHHTCYRLLHGIAILDPKITSKRKHVEYESLSGLWKLHSYEMMITFLSFCSQMNILHPSDISLVVSCIVTGQCAESTRSCFHAGGVPNFMHKKGCVVLQLLIHWIPMRSRAPES